MAVPALTIYHTLQPSSRGKRITFHLCVLLQVASAARVTPQGFLGNIQSALTDDGVQIRLQEAGSPAVFHHRSHGLKTNGKRYT